MQCNAMQGLVNDHERGFRRQDANTSTHECKA